MEGHINQLTTVVLNLTGKKSIADVEDDYPLPPTRIHDIYDSVQLMVTAIMI